MSAPRSLLCFILATTMAFAASPLTSSDGERIEGRIVGICLEGVLVLDRADGAPRAWTWDALDLPSVRTEHAVPLRLAGGDRLTARVIEVTDAHVVVATSWAPRLVIPREALAPADQPLATDAFAEARTDARIERGLEEAVQEAEQAGGILEPHDWRGKIALLGSVRTGNTDSFNIALRSEANRQWTEDRLALKLDAGYGETESELTSSSVFGSAKFDHFYTEDFYAYGNVSALFDDVADINLRAILGVGAGANVWRGAEDPSKQLLDVELGISAIYEDFGAGGSSDLDPAIRAAYTYKNFFFEKAEFVQTFEFVAPFSDLDAFIIRAVASLAVPLDESWNLTNSLEIDWQGDPAPGAKALDLTFLLGLEYSF